MADPTEYYVDPAINANSGTGTSGDPWGDLQYALNSITRNTTSGDRVNIKAGTSESLAAALDLTTYGTPSAAAPLMFRGYTSSAGDGGIGVIDGAGSFALFSSTTLSHVHLKDLRVTNGGSANLVATGGQCYFENLRIDNTTGRPLNITAGGVTLYRVRCDNYGNAALVTSNTDTYACVFDPTPRTPTQALTLSGTGNIIHFCRFRVTGTTVALVYSANFNSIRNNAIAWVSGSGSGTGAGIQAGASSLVGVAVLNNYVEGFSGTGGAGIKDSNAATKPIYSAFGFNKAYNCTTAFDVTGDKRNDLGNDATLGASGLGSPAGGDFSPNSAIDDEGYPASFPTF